MFSEIKNFNAINHNHAAGKINTIIFANTI